MGLSEGYGCFSFVVYRKRSEWCLLTHSYIHFLAAAFLAGAFLAGAFLKRGLLLTAFLMGVGEGLPSGPRQVSTIDLTYADRVSMRVSIFQR